MLSLFWPAGRTIASVAPVATLPSLSVAGVAWGEFCTVRV